MAIVTPGVLAALNTSLKKEYGDAYAAQVAESVYKRVATIVPSSSASNTYGWLGDFPQMREWIGSRVVKDMRAQAYQIANKLYEGTVGVPRVAIEDDEHGHYGARAAMMGQEAAQFPDRMIATLLAGGAASLCYDGQNFFDTDHPVPDPAGAVTIGGRTFRLVSNMQAGTGPAWFLFDTSRAVRSLIWQEREKYEFQTVNRHDDARVFMTDGYLYGIRARANVGFGLWQLAYGSKAALTAANYAAARAAMSRLKGDKGRILGIRPTVLVVPPALEEAALTLLNAETNDGGGSNPWKGTAEVIVSPWLSDEAEPEEPEEE